MQEKREKMDGRQILIKAGAKEEDIESLLEYVQNRFSDKFVDETP